MQMWQQSRSNAHEVFNQLPFGKADNRIHDLFEVRQGQPTSFNFDFGIFLRHTHFSGVVALRRSEQFRPATQAAGLRHRMRLFWCKESKVTTAQRAISSKDYALWRSHSSGFKLE